MRIRAILAVILIAGCPNAIAQAPPPVPALPDAARITTYSLSASTCACSVGFQIYGDGTDIDQWLDVYVNGVAYPSTDGTHGWSLSSVTGALGSIPRPITNAVLTFAGPQTGSVSIVGARRPRRAAQFVESRGVSARELNQVITDLVASQRELWDQGNSTVRGQPGDFFKALPPAATRANQYLGFDGSGAPTLVPPPGGSTGGPIFSSGIPGAGQVAIWQDSTHLIGVTNLTLTGTIDANNMTSIPGNPAAPAFAFRDSGVVGYNFPDTQTHFGFVIAAGSPLNSTTGSYTSLASQAVGFGRSSSAYITGATLQAIATSGAGNYTGSNSYAIACGTTVVPGQCPSGMASNVNSLVGQEINLFDYPGATIFSRQGIRIADYGQVVVSNLSAGIDMVKTPAAVGFQYGINFGEGAGTFPIIATGTLFKANSTTKINSAMDFQNMPDDPFNTAAIIFPEGATALYWVPAAGTQSIAVSAGGGFFGVKFGSTNTFVLSPTGVSMPVLPTAVVSGSGQSLCIDTAGNVYKKATCP